MPASRSGEASPFAEDVLLSILRTLAAPSGSEPSPRMIEAVVSETGLPLQVVKRYLLALVDILAVELRGRGRQGTLVTLTRHGLALLEDAAAAPCFGGKVGLAC